MLARDDVPELCDQLAVLLSGNSDVTALVYDLSAVTRPDVVTVEALALLQLTARRAGRAIRVHGASEALRDLLNLTGLGGVLDPGPELPVEPGR